MKALDSAKSSVFPHNTLMSYINLYEKIGKSDKYFSLLDEYIVYYSKTTITDDIRYLLEFFDRFNGISESRFKIVVGDKSINPKNKDEELLLNLYHIFSSIRKVNLDLMNNVSKIRFEFTSNEFRNIAEKISKTNQFRRSNDGVKTEDKLSQILNKYVKLVNSNEIDKLSLISCLIIDFLKLSPFTEYNEMIALIALGIILIQETNFKALNYVSFFKILNDFKDEFNISIKKAHLMYDDGLVDINSLILLILKILTISYSRLENIYLEKSFITENLSKKVQVLNVIHSLGTEFSKSDIKNKVPDISVSTIDRLLKELQDQRKIAAFSKGRNAKWVLLDNKK